MRERSSSSDPVLPRQMASEMDTMWIQLSPKTRGKAYRFDQKLIQLSQSITALLKSNKQRDDAHVWATLDDFLGAVYALILAFHNTPPFKNRPRGQSIDSRVVLKRAKTIWVSRNIRTRGKWIAGFYFNSALFRLASVYHRSLKIGIGEPTSRDHVGRENDPNSLISKAKERYQAWKNSAWENTNIHEIHQQVNQLKHQAEGSYYGRTVNEDQAMSAARELLEFLEAWERFSTSSTTRQTPLN